jgi:ferrous iron transport protein B
MRRETNSWRWPVFAFSYLLALGYGASFVTYRIVASLTVST